MKSREELLWRAADAANVHSAGDRATLLSMVMIEVLLDIRDAVLKMSAGQPDRRGL